jgi:hypothetical protein
MQDVIYSGAKLHLFRAAISQKFELRRNANNKHSYRYARAGCEYFIALIATG